MLLITLYVPKKSYTTQSSLSNVLNSRHSKQFNGVKKIKIKKAHLVYKLFVELVKVHMTMVHKKKSIVFSEL